MQASDNRIGVLEVACCLSCSVSFSTHPDKDGLIPESVASLGQVLNRHSVRAIAGWIIQAMLLHERHEHSRQLHPQTRGLVSNDITPGQSKLTNPNILSQLSQHEMQMAHHYYV